VIGVIGMWPRIANILIGIWLMAAPAVLAYGGNQATNDRIVGPLAAGFAAIAIWQVTRPLRRLNVAIGVWLLLAPWLFGADWSATLNSIICGALLTAFALRPGPQPDQLGGGWRAVWYPSGADEMTR
jgi:hypothetical protein